jgi:hypothetical protein
MWKLSRSSKPSPTRLVRTASSSREPHVVDEVEGVEHVDAVRRNFDLVRHVLVEGVGGVEPGALEAVDYLLGLEVDAEQGLDPVVGHRLLVGVEVRADELGAVLVGGGRAVGVVHLDLLDGRAPRREGVADDVTHPVDRPLVGAGELDEQLAGAGRHLGALPVDDGREREEPELVVDRGVAVEVLDEVGVRPARVVLL